MEVFVEVQTVKVTMKFIISMVTSSILAIRPQVQPTS